MVSAPRLCTRFWRRRSSTGSIERYLRDVPSCIAEDPISRIDELLPWDLAAEATSDERLAA